jgi:1,4-alpha-glucan branching enzyme
LEVFDSLERDGVDWRLTMSVTPTLAAMLSDPLLQYRYVRHLDNLLGLAVKEVERTRWQPEFRTLAQMYHTRFTRARDIFVRQYDNNLLNGFRRFYDLGKLELITCGATHGFLPLMPNRQAVRAQVEIGAQEFERHFGRRPQGLWLPECGYLEGLDEVLRDAGIRYFFVDTHGILFAEPRPRFGVYAPLMCPRSGVAALARDHESSKQVWSAIEGYPGDYHYREFYRDVGFDLDYEYLKPHLHDIGVRTNLGIKYYKITGPGNHKEPYQPQAALDKAAEHAGNFMFNREKQVQWLAGAMDGRPPLIIAPYDAELFGHWWFEGPDWLNFLLRKIHFDQQNIKTTNIPEYLDKYPKIQVGQPTLSSWGYKGYCEVWLEGSNDWVYPHLHEMSERMVEAARQNPDPSPLRRRALNQMARELLLAQSSDWAFIMKTGTMVDYARERTGVHVLNCNHLFDQLRHNDIDEPWLAEIERRHNLFPNLDYRVYSYSSRGPK